MPAFCHFWGCLPREYWAMDHTDYRWLLAYQQEVQRQARNAQR
jgi:hypothetical protein